MDTITPQVRVKSYFANSITDAIERAQSEMGPDAFLLNNRPAPPEARHLGQVEVVFGESIRPQAEAEVAGAVAAPSVVAAAVPPVAVTPAAAEIGVLTRKIDEIGALLTKYGVNLPPPNARRRFVEQTLIDAGVDSKMAAEIDDAVARRTGNNNIREISRAGKPQETDLPTLVRETIAELTDRIQVRPTLGSVVALVGPPGAGKTMTLVKLAVKEGLMKRRQVRILSADWQKIGASEQLRIYSAILGVPFQSVDSASALSRAIDAPAPNSLVLIDTPGLSPSAMDGTADDLARALAGCQEIDTHLVLTATTRSQDLAKTSERFAPFRPAALIFTHMDEAESVSSVFSEAVRSGLPLSYLCNGQSVPENIDDATAISLAESLARRLPDVVSLAA